MSAPRLRAAWTVVDLGFGDGGKGLIIDHLAATRGAELVVRFNGGGQAAHNVHLRDGRHHTFAQLGSGSFRGAWTLLGPAVIVHPTALLVESRILEGKGMPAPLSRLLIHADCPLVTPFHQALNRLRELSRGAARHGSCGVGIGEVARDVANGDALRAHELRAPAALRRAAQRVRERMSAQAAALDLPDSEAARAERSVFSDPGLVDRWVDRAAVLAAAVVDEERAQAQVDAASTVLFEGAQGVLLDARWGFHPFTTYSDCTFAGAEALQRRWAPDREHHRVGVMRAITVRHGPGPLPTEDPTLADALRPYDDNEAGAWQGAVRYGHWDAGLMRYALEVLGGVDVLVTTWMDRVPAMDRWRYADGWISGGVERRALPVDPAATIAGQAALGMWLTSAVPVLRAEAAAPSAVLASIAHAIGRPVDWISNGRRAEDVGPPPRVRTRGR